MATCSGCNNNYEQSFEIIIQNKSYHFDCFECAIHMLAPICQNCGCKIIGHGIESAEYFYCSSHCAKTSASQANAKTINRPENI